MRRALPLGLLLLTATACAAPQPRDYVNEESGFRYTLPPGWHQFPDDAKSRGGTLLSVQVHSLEGARRTFVEQLPDSMRPQLDEWTAYYFIRLGEPVKEDVTLGGGPATRYTYPIRIRQSTPPSRAMYWVARHGDLLYILRATLPPGEPEGEEQALRQLLSTWEYVEAKSAPAPLAEGGVSGGR